MGINFNSGSSVWVKTRNDSAADGKDGASNVNSASMASFSDDIGWKEQTAATTDTGTFSLIQLFKRFLSIKLPLGANTTANALCAALPTDDVIRTNTANISTKSDAIATSTASADTKLSTINTSIGTTNTTLASIVPKAVIQVNYNWTRPADATAYTAGDVISNSTVTSTVPFWDNLVANNGDTGYITKIVLTCSHNTPYSLRLSLYKATITTAPDNAPNTLTDADIVATNLIALVDIPALTPMNITGGAGGNSATTLTLTTPIPFTTGATKGLFGHFAIATGNATIASAVFDCTLVVQRL
jgi:hypothetical protein